MVPETGIEPVRPLFTKAADFKSDVSTNFTTQAQPAIVQQKTRPAAARRVFIARGRATPSARR